MKPEHKVLTYAQAKEIKWFVSHCTGTRLEFYSLMNEMEKFKEKLDRLIKTGEAIEKYFPDLYSEQKDETVSDMKAGI